MASLLYGLSALAAPLCAVLLLRAYRGSGNSLLLWSGLCFCGLMISNVILLVDKLVVPEANLLPLRLCVTALSMLLLLYGLIYRSE
jgi:hypothetical protein